MAQVSVLGLGAMGSTLARVLLKRGHDVTVWNRSDSERAAGLEAAGVRRAALPAAAASAAPLVLMCVTDYPAAEEVLASPGVLAALAGRTFVQLTNGNEEQVRTQLTTVRAAGAGMLAGGILGYPRHIGRAETVIMYAGDAAAFAENEATLAGLAGAQRYLGEDPGPPNAVYVAAFGFYFAALAGFLEAAALAESRGVPPDEFAAAMPGMAALLLDHIDDAARRIGTGDFAGDQATVDVHLVGSERRRRTLEDAGLQALMTGAFVGYCRQAHDAGDGGEDIAAIFKRVKRPPAGGLSGRVVRPPAGA
jgi:3-hydroxyisobutyrate dehydrogenase-like beta-hydroxyacid dehydrogenase